MGIMPAVVYWVAGSGAVGAVHTRVCGPYTGHGSLTDQQVLQHFA